MKHTVTVPMEFNIEFDEEWALGMDKEALELAINARIQTTIKEVMEGLSSDEFCSKLVTACWAKIHDPK